MELNCKINKKLLARARIFRRLIFSLRRRLNLGQLGEVRSV